MYLVACLKDTPYLPFICLQSKIEIVNPFCTVDEALLKKFKMIYKKKKGGIDPSLYFFNMCPEGMLLLLMLYLSDSI